MKQVNSHSNQLCPIIIHGKELSKLLKSLPSQPKVVDQMDFFLEELFRISNPASIFLTQKEYRTSLDKFNTNLTVGADAKYYGHWIYFPWCHAVYHVLPESEHQKVMTNRNLLLISADEQRELHQKIIAVAGLSIGASMVRCLAQMGIGGTIKLADSDILSLSNTNRLQYDLTAVGESKLSLISQTVWQINPFTQIFGFPNGVHDDSIESFLGTPKPDILFDEIDDFYMKVRLRIEAKKRKIPLLMFTNLGDNVLVDIERYDTTPTQLPFHGLVGEGLLDSILESRGHISIELQKKCAVQLVGIENIPERARNSVPLIGKELVGRPQLFSTLSIAAGLCGQVARNILLGRLQPSCRKLITNAV